MFKEIIHNIFEDSTRKFPANTAIDNGKSRITYDKLNADANRIAHALIENGTGSHDIIGLYFDASIAYVTALLGVIKAGAIFMPLNPQFPETRLKNILNRTKPNVFITSNVLENEIIAKLKKVISSTKQYNLLIIDEAGNLKLKNLPGGDVISINASLTDDNPSIATLPDDGCYLMTTSGSTGEPKIILGSHKGLQHFVQWEIGEFSLDDSVRTSLLSAATFDVSLRDIFVPLCTGGTLCIPDEEIRHNPGKLLYWLRDNRITLTHIVPTVFRLLTREILEIKSDIDVLPDLKYVLIAGEVLYGNDVICWRQAYGKHVELVNLYGPTETTLAKLFYRIGDTNFSPDEIVPIGKPLPDTEVLVIKNGKLSPVDETGEIYIKTPFMNKGYYNTPSLNEVSFIQNPLVTDRREIVYKTGDQGRLTSDGNYRFEGRLDGQVKLYGNRVEINEIEIVLRQHSQVRDAAVTVKQDKFGNMRLCAYIVPPVNQKPTIESLRNFLADRLPDYMLPSTFVTLDELPLTHSGKVDRGALPEPDQTRPELEQTYVGPSNNQEKALRDLWCRVLGLNEIGIMDNFFDLGGTSILAVKLITLLRETLQIEMPVIKLFQYPNIKAMSEYLSQNQSSQEALYSIQERARLRNKFFSRRRTPSEER